MELSRKLQLTTNLDVLMKKNIKKKNLLVRIINGHIRIDRIAQTHFGDGALQKQLVPGAAAHLWPKCKRQIPQQIQILFGRKIETVVQRQHFIHISKRDIRQCRYEFGEFLSDVNGIKSVCIHSVPRAAYMQQTETQLI